MNPLLAALIQAGLLSQQDADRLNRQFDSQTAREHAEQQMLLAFGAGLSGQRDRLVDAVRASDGLLSVAQQNRLWAGENELLWVSVRESILDVASERAVLATAGAGDVSMWALVNDAVIEHAERYYTSTAQEDVGSIPNLNQTSRNAFARAFNDWQQGVLPNTGMDGLPELIRNLKPIFGRVRSEAIGVTETTRLFSGSELAAGNANPFIGGWIYNTAMDANVSDFCRGADGAVMLKGETTFSDGGTPPPRHVRCRSGITAVTLPALEALREQGLTNA